MTVLLVLCTIVIFLATDHLVQRARLSKAAQPALEREENRFRIPEGVSLASNHMWMRIDEGVATVGLDEFLGRMLGAVESVVLPGVGVTVEPPTPHIALRDRDRGIRLASPVAGRILEVNTGVLRHPATAHRDPYGSGWLMKIAVSERPSSGRGLYGAAARRWLNEQTAHAKDFFTSRIPSAQLATLQDGGDLVDGVLKQCDRPAWEEFERRFVSLERSQPITR